MLIIKKKKKVVWLFLAYCVLSEKVKTLSLKLSKLINKNKNISYKNLIFPQKIWLVMPFT